MADAGQAAAAGSKGTFRAPGPRKKRGACPCCRFNYAAGGGENLVAYGDGGRQPLRDVAAGAEEQKGDGEERAVAVGAQGRRGDQEGGGPVAQHMAAPQDSAQHHGGGGGEDRAGDQGPGGGRPRQDLPAGLQRPAGRAAPQVLRLLPLHVRRARDGGHVPLHGQGRLLQRHPALLRGRRRRQDGVELLQGGDPSAPAEGGDPVGQQPEARGEVHPARVRREPRVLAHGVRQLQQRRHALARSSERLPQFTSVTTAFTSRAAYSCALWYRLFANYLMLDSFSCLQPFMLALSTQ